MYLSQLRSTKGLRVERVKLLLPFSISPFHDETKQQESSKGEEDEDEDDKSTLGPEGVEDELKVKTASEVPWIDLVSLQELETLTF
jgi:hypothetical protein